jgi:hypothetical protein
MAEGQYGYCAVEKNWQDWAGFVLAATAETEWWANYVQCTTLTNNVQTSKVLWELTFTEIQANKCTSFTECTAVDCCDQETCTYEKWEWELRYLYVQ